MKLLVVGIDGGDKRIIDAMEMPFIKKLFAEQACIQVEEDLWSRGWAEILSGAHGRELGAFYTKPKLDGTHAVTQSFKSGDYARNPNVIPLWQRFAASNQSTGFMNVPTMMPSPQVHGFAISGGGAGASTSGGSGIPSEAVHPVEEKSFLEQANYVLDTRFVASGLTGVDDFFNQLMGMEEKRSQCFIDLCKRYSPDFGFLTYVSTTRIQYLAMSEIESLIRNSGVPANEFQKRIAILYAQLDTTIANVVNSLQPQYVMIVSDHSSSPRLHSVNVNSWLMATGHQYAVKSPDRSVKNLARLIASSLPRGIRKSITKSAPRLVSELAVQQVDWTRSDAFGIRYTPGIYINDKARFGGRLASDGEINIAIQDLITQFNESSDAKKLGLTAREYRRHYRDAQYEALLPDIWIDHPDTVFFEQHGSFIAPNHNYGPIKSLTAIDRDQYTGIKGRYPLLCVDKVLASCIETSDQMDLTLAYHLIVRALNL